MYRFENCYANKVDLNWHDHLMLLLSTILAMAHDGLFLY